MLKLSTHAIQRKLIRTTVLAIQGTTCKIIKKKKKKLQSYRSWHFQQEVAEDIHECMCIVTHTKKRCFFLKKKKQHFVASSYGSLTTLPYYQRHKNGIVINIKIKIKAKLWRNNTSDERQRILIDPVILWCFFSLKQLLHSSWSSSIHPQQLNATSIFASWGLPGVILTTDKDSSVMKSSH